MSARRAGPGRPRAGKAECPLLGVVAKPTVPGRVVEAVLPQPRDLPVIVAAFAKLGIFELTLEFGPDGLHIYGAAEQQAHCTRVASLLVTIPAAAMASYFCSGPPRLVSASRLELAGLCEKIAASHQLAELFLHDDFKELHLRLRSAGLSSDLHCVVGEALPEQRFPIEPNPESHACHWRADFKTVVSPLLAALPTGVTEQVEVRCRRAGDGPGFQVEVLTRLGGSPSASVASTSFLPSAGALRPGEFVHADYSCSVFVAVRQLATPAHTLEFHLDASSPLVVIGSPNDGRELLESCYFRLEMPVVAA